MMEHPPGYINRHVCESVCVCITQRDRLQSVPHSRHAQHLGDERQGMQNLNNGNYP